MKFGKVLRWVLPALAGVVFIGSGFAVFYYASPDSPLNQSMDAGLQIESIAESGEFTAVNEVYLNSDKQYTEYFGQGYLIIDGNGAEFPFDAFHPVYTAGTNWTSSVTMHFFAQLDTGSAKDIEKYFTVRGGWELDADTGIYSLDLGTKDIYANGQVLNLYAQVPSFVYKTVNKPTTVDELQKLKEAISDDVLKFSFHAEIVREGETG